MQYCYCPHEGCAAKVPYEAIKPTKCPRCNRTFASAFAPTAPVPAPISRAAVVEDDDTPTRPLTRSALAKARASVASTTRVKPHRGPQPSRIMNAPAEFVPPDLPDDGEEEDEYVDEQTISRRARELAASIDPSTIVIADSDEGVFKFAQFEQEAKQAGVVAPKVVKKRGKR